MLTFKAITGLLKTGKVRSEKREGGCPIDNDSSLELVENGSSKCLQSWQLLLQNFLGKV